MRSQWPSTAMRSSDESPGKSFAYSSSACRYSSGGRGRAQGDPLHHQALLGPHLGREGRQDRARLVLLAGEGRGPHPGHLLVELGVLAGRALEEGVEQIAHDRRRRLAGHERVHVDGAHLALGVLAGAEGDVVDADADRSVERPRLAVAGPGPEAPDGGRLIGRAAQLGAEADLARLLEETLQHRARVGRAGDREPAQGVEVDERVDARGVARRQRRGHLVGERRPLGLGPRAHRRWRHVAPAASDHEQGDDQEDAHGEVLHAEPAGREAENQSGQPSSAALLRRAASARAQVAAASCFFSAGASGLRANAARSVARRGSWSRPGGSRRLRAGAGASVSGPGRGGNEEPRQGNYPSPIAIGGGNTRITTTPDFDDDSGSNQAAGTMPVKIPGLIPWGGLMGPRAASCSSVRRTAALNNVAILGYACYTGEGGGGTSATNIQVEWRPPGKLRFYTMDDQTPANYNITQGIDLEAAPASMPALTVDYSGKSLSELMFEAGTRSILTANVFPPAAGKVAAVSWVLPHGDYRLSCIPMKVGSGMFVAHGTNAHSSVEPYTDDHGTTYMAAPGGRFNGAEEANQGGLLYDGNGGMPIIPPKFRPHLAPVKKQYLCDPKLGTAPYPGVLQTASTIGAHAGFDPTLRQLRMAHGRMDGDGSRYPHRGSSDPLETGDFDTGVGLAPDGPYINHPDEGDARSALPYYWNLTLPANSRPAASSPNRLMRGPVDFGSLPSGSSCAGAMADAAIPPGPRHVRSSRASGQGERPSADSARPGALLPVRQLLRSQRPPVP